MKILIDTSGKTFLKRLQIIVRVTFKTDFQKFNKLLGKI